MYPPIPPSSLSKAKPLAKAKPSAKAKPCAYYSQSSAKCAALGRGLGKSGKARSINTFANHQKEVNIDCVVTGQRTRILFELMKMFSLVELKKMLKTSHKTNT